MLIPDGLSSALALGGFAVLRVEPALLYSDSRHLPGPLPEPARVTSLLLALTIEVKSLFPSLTLRQASALLSEHTGDL